MKIKRTNLAKIGDIIRVDYVREDPELVLIAQTDSIEVGGYFARIVQLISFALHLGGDDAACAYPRKMEIHSKYSTLDGPETQTKKMDTSVFTSDDILYMLDGPEVESLAMVSSVGILNSHYLVHWEEVSK